MSSPPLRIAAASYGDPQTRRLVAEVQAEYTVRYGGPDDSPLEDHDLAPPRGAFFLGHADGEPVAMGGWVRRFDVHPFGRSGAAEVKRMYVVPGARRRGYARAMLTHLETTAREAGADVMVLETGTVQPEAIRLYLASGYELIEKFGYYAWSPRSRCFGKPL